MRRVFIGIIFICGLFLTGCTGGFSNPGSVTTRDFDVEEFHSLEVGFPFEIVWSESAESTVTITMGQNLFNRLDVSVRQGVLRLTNSGGSININTTRNMPRLYITSPSMESVNISSAASISGWDTITSDEFRMNVSGAASVNLDLDVNDFNATFSGASSVNLSGQGNNADITSSGAASISAFDLQLLNGNVVLSGAGSVEINASNELDVRLSGVGSITYMGNPQITRSVSGIGTIRQAN